MTSAISAELEPCSFDALAGWLADDPAESFQAFRRSAIYAAGNAYRSGRLGPPFEAFRSSYAAAIGTRDADTSTARAFFEQYFEPVRIRAPGFVTGFYEPVADASPVASARYRFPVYGVPDDLIPIGDSNRPPGFDPEFRFARLGASGEICEYWDRSQIESGALARRGLEIAWLADRVDLFFIHVQGAARLQMTDGRTLRITYAAKSGHPFTGPGRVLAQLGEIAPEKVTMQAIRAWLAAHPERMDEILWQNRSFIFFREAPVDNPALGPVAAAKVPLTPGRSLAVARLLHTFSTPFFIEAPELRATGGEPFCRLMIAQDTGSAILGPARGDLFIGSGDAAGEIAGVIRHAAEFFVLWPKSGGGR